MLIGSSLKLDTTDLSSVASWIFVLYLKRSLKLLHHQNIFVYLFFGQSGTLVWVRHSKHLACLNCALHLQFTMRL